MQLIPVIDLKGGQVVHARRGARGHYRPVSSPLVASADPLEVAAALMGLAPFRALYVADLDAIAGAGGNGAVVLALAARHPSLELWVDEGARTAHALAAQGAAGRGVPVAASESLDPAEARAALKVPGVILSLDRGVEGPRGPAFLHEEEGLWPPRVIAMTLARVGSGEGPDLAVLSDILRRRPDVAAYAAGGVRGVEDLLALEAAGVAGALVATALHDGRLKGADIARFA